MLLFGLVVSILICSFLVSADVIGIPDPTHKDIPVVNNLTNIGDFPDYVFVAFSGNPRCGTEVIASDGIVPPDYSGRCSFANVYAVNKTDFNDSLVDEGSRAFYDFLNFSSSPMILSDIEISRSVPVTDTESAIYNSYEINFSQPPVSPAHSEPVNTEVETDYSFYFYLLIPAIALVIVIWVLVARRKNGKSRKNRK